MEIVKLRTEIARLDKLLKPFDDMIKERELELGKDYTAMTVCSSQEAFLDCNELEEYRNLIHERFLFSQELEGIYKMNFLKNKKEIIQTKRKLSRAGIKVPEDLMIEELREFNSKHGLT